MSLLSNWREHAYSKDMNSKEGKIFWDNYLEIEKGIYKQLLGEPDTIIEGTIIDLAAKYNTTIPIMTGFLDGINDSLISPNPIEDMTEDTKVSLHFDKEKLYYNMVSVNADWLYHLPEWDPILSNARRKELYLSQRKSNTIINDKKISRNEPCICKSGKKYKFCCGKKV